jgi:hypothetical protein
MASDAAAEAAWRSDIQLMDPDEIVAGISKGGCCDLCSPGAPGGCVITNPAPHSGGVCGHPLLTKDLQHLDENGQRHFAYADNLRCMQNYRAAMKRLKMLP